MRKNYPVSQHQYPLDASTKLMSVTTPDSHIIYANADFIKVSGYQSDELMDQPHNIIRHPDMPPLAFADMWSTLKAGKIWTGIVKNRCKNGDHYWVKSSTTPLKKEGKLIGYMSVRTAASSEEIQQSETLYAMVNEGKLRHRTFHYGLLVYRGPLKWLSMFKTMPLRWRIRSYFALLGLLPLAMVFSLLIHTPLVWMLFPLLILCSGLFCELLVLHVAKPIERILEQAMRSAAGQADNLVQLNRADEVGMLMRAVNQSGMNFRTFVDDVNNNLNALKNACSEIAQGNSTLAECCEKTEENLQQTAASVEQLTATIKSNADASVRASEYAEDVNQVVNAGEKAVSEVASTMDTITQASERITDIISVLDNIAFQTNILAVNAAVEAAHAGEQGKSFAVVASEVRSLAQRSANSAKNIAELIDDTLSSIRTGDQQVAHTNKSMSNILTKVQQVTRLMNEISMATKEQSQGLNLINDAVNKIDALTHQNTALASQSNSATGHLQQQISTMAQAVSVFSASN
ncbi:methyl-accepting chemotaxis protein [Pectobacteriaceae bacterium CE70]|uniref:Chemotaxis protein n=1 Tax=Serratia sp. (strain ATCC 39006) TaxID=104623 RepID=A0A2I5T7L5_SERS3|nr:MULTISPECIES: PAS domain-containing methyl-accepting chemotaxis protein [Enterobacterales]WJV60759.1 methyl-accepting chemotaxis protein [Pectobacteriaceae bacterium C52]WJV68799.1 methyl-accepting chemotaxis protein [Pectobacteriaceae bacterium CE70]WJY12722.1 methyl-accepting chemotaxis protein [Pectobacteriaceae bacterium C80]AUH00560.1 chemotaxis protein [Serratia sp. ATCC 39006]AUH04881.1 chemotaxis protein [Serratia sp. ATCC 39006]